MARQQRVERVREAIKGELGDIIQKLKDPRIGFTTVTDVEVSSDLRHVKAYVSVYGTDEAKEATMKALNHAKGHVRTEIGKRVRLHHTPEIMFVFDSSLEYGARINELLRTIRTEDEVDGTTTTEDEAEDEQA
ncbi:MAG: 30S ribosome-binding factor RbfA [Firmicutes bacterium]|nr:30S ribosome-binding factor RbfA [Bacillota bacterium]